MPPAFSAIRSSFMTTTCRPDPHDRRFIVGDQNVGPQQRKSVFDIAVSRSANPATLTLLMSFYRLNTTETGYAPTSRQFGYNKTPLFHAKPIRQFWASRPRRSVQ